jgi:hypothetical protein
MQKDAYKKFYLRPSYCLGRLQKVRSYGDLVRLYKGFSFLTGLWK